MPARSQLPRFVCALRTNVQGLRALSHGQMLLIKFVNCVKPPPSRCCSRGPPSSGITTFATDTDPEPLLICRFSLTARLFDAVIAGPRECDARQDVQRKSLRSRRRQEFSMSFMLPSPGYFARRSAYAGMACARFRKLWSYGRDVDGHRKRLDVAGVADFGISA